MEFKEMHNARIPITIRELLGTSILHNPKVVAGECALDNPSHLIVILETPGGIDWLHGGEIVMTAGYALYHDPELKSNLIRASKKAGAAALCIKEGRYFGPINQQLISDANEFGLPVIVLPQDTNYSQIIANYYEYLFSKNNQHLLQRNKAYYEILSLQSEDTKLEDVVSRLSAIIHCPVNFTNHYQEDNLLVDFRKIDQRPRRLCGPKKDYIRFVIKTKEILSYLDVYSTQELDDFQVKGINYAISIMKNILLNQQASRWNESELHHTLGLILHNNKEQPNAIFLKQINEIMYWQENSYYVICARYYCTSSDLDAPNNDVTRRTINKNIRKYLEESQLGKFLYIEKENEMIICANTQKETLESLLHKLFYNTVTLSSHIRIGVSSQGLDLSEYNSLLQEAQIASWQEQSYSFYDDLGTRRYLKSFIQDSASLDLYHNTVNKLKLYDEQHDTALLASLEAYFNNNMNRKKTADSLFIHPETLRYRLKQIEDICGSSPYESEGIFQLMLGIAIKEFTAN